jgi:8-oxo-dGTP pyrophosphatase MutT (NUDIX family)
VVLLDAASRVLLFEGRDLADQSDTERWWFTAGGGVEEGESLIEAARRELWEETALSGLQLAGPLHVRQVDFLNHGEPLSQVEHYFAARTADVAVGASGWTELEQKAVTAWRWWSIAELETTSVRYFPQELTELVRRADHLV